MLFLRLSVDVAIDGILLSAAGENAVVLNLGVYDFDDVFVGSLGTSLANGYVCWWIKFCFTNIDSERPEGCMNDGLRVKMWRTVPLIGDEPLRDKVVALGTSFPPEPCSPSNNELLEAGSGATLVPDCSL
jgi:hypothetical protein